MASKKQSQFAELTDISGAYLSGHKSGDNYKIATSSLASATHGHAASGITNDSGVTGTDVKAALDNLQFDIDNVNVGSIAYTGVTLVPATSLLGNPTGAQANASAVTLDASMAFSGTTLAVNSTTTPAAGAIPEGDGSGSLVGWIPDATNAVKGIVQFGGDLASTSTATSQVVSKATFNSVQYTLGALTDTETLVVSGSTITSAAPAAGATICSQGEAEAGADNTKVMTPLRTHQAVVAYGTLGLFTGYSAKTPVDGADLVLINDSAAGNALKKAQISDLITAAAGLSAATQPQAIALTSNAVAITPLRVADLNTEYRMFSEQATAVATTDTTISRSITCLDTGAVRCFLPSSTAKIPTSLIYNDTAAAVDVYPYEGNVSSGAYLNGHVKISFPRTAALGGLEATTLTKLTGIVEFTVDAWPVDSPSAPDTRYIMQCCTFGTPAGFYISQLTAAAVGYIEFAGFNGVSSTPTFKIRSHALTLSTGTLIEMIFSFDLTTAVMTCYIDGVSDALDGITPVWPVALNITLPVSTVPWCIGGRASDTGIPATADYAYLGNIYRIALWKDLFVDLSDGPTMAKFRSGTSSPVNLGKTGWRPTGAWATPASLYLNRSGDNFRINQAPNFLDTSNVTGTLSGSTATPAPANNATLLSTTVARANTSAAHSIRNKTAPVSLPAGSRAGFTVVEGTTTYAMSGGA